MPLYSVVICTYERYDRLPLAIESVLKQTAPVELFDLWIIDNSPALPERSATRAQYEADPRVHYIEAHIPGLSNARNLAIQKTSAPWLIFLDDDAIADPNWIAAYHDVIASRGEEVGAVGGRVLPDFESPRPPWLHDELLCYLSVFEQGPEVIKLPELLSPIGANVAFRRSLLIQKGGFDPALGRTGPERKNLMSGEEFELFHFLHAIGKQVLYAPGALVRHFIPSSRLTRAWFRRRVAWQSVSDQVYCEPTREDTLKMWLNFMSYLNRVPKEHLPYAGLFWDTDDPELFLMQVRCAQYFAHFLLAEGGYPPERVVQGTAA